MHRPIIVAQNIIRRGVSSVTCSSGHSLSKKTVLYGGTGITIFSVGYLASNPKKRKQLTSIIAGIARFTRSIRIGLTISLDYWIAPLMGYKDKDIHKRAADRIVQGCLKNGGLYIKLGQGLATINHILPKEYTDTLSVLQDKCLIREINEVEEIFLEDFGKKPNEIFQKLEPDPIAAASLAQVYKGVTHDGDTVAIKVQYIDLRERFNSDLKTLTHLLKLVTLMHPKFDLHWVLHELFDTLAQELDFTIEGKNSERCAQDLKKYKYVYVPKVRWDLTTERILTTEWIDGVKVSDTEGLNKEGLNIADIDSKLVSIMAEQIFRTGFVHADPHPGNVLIRKGKDKKAQIVLLDHGLYEHLDEKTRISLCNFWESMVLRDNVSLKLYAKQLNVEDYTLLAEMLTQAPYDISLMSNTQINGMTAEEYMIQQAQDRFDKVTEVLRSMPKPMMLTIRNLNIIRSITNAHGDLIDRYKIMARIAVSGKYQVLNQSFIRKVVLVLDKIRFETYLWFHCIIQSLFNIYLNILEYMGYNVREIMEMYTAV